MKKTLLTLYALCALAMYSNAQCTPNAANIYTFSANGKTYEIIKENLTWAAAAACAVTRGGKLAEIRSQAEQDAIFTNVNLAGITASSTRAPDGGNSAYLWIGGNDITTEGTWVWDGDNNGTSTQFWQGTTSGSVVGGEYNNWGTLNSREPDDFFGQQDNLGFAFTAWPNGSAGQWNDLMGTNSLYYIVEKPLNLLPITLINFSGEYKNDVASLQWKVGEQSKFSYFEIQRNEDGTNDFHTIKQIALANTATYNYTDNTTAGANLFYRLKMVDLDGKFSYSNIININTRPIHLKILDQGAIANFLRIGGIGSKGNLRILDASGKILVKQVVQSQNISINVTALKTGWYVLQYINEKNIESVRFLKQ